MSPRTPRFLSLATLTIASTLAACAATLPTTESLWGSAWQLQSLGSQAVPAQPLATLTFPQTGQVAGNGSCNRFFGPVEVDRDRVKFGPLAATKMACMGGASEQESRYLAALQKAQRWEVHGDTLLIHATGMDQPLRFVRTARQP